MAVERTTVRRARKQHRCDDAWCSREVIEPGELYLEHIVSPGHDIACNTRWLRHRECAHSAAERGITLDSVTSQNRKDAT